MTILRKEDLLSLEEYSTKREELRATIIEFKKNRIVKIGENVSLLFENKDTIKYQIQEMLRIEKIFEFNEIEEELSAYNPLIPDGSNLKATMLIEFTDEEERKKRLKEMHLVEGRVWIQLGENEKVFAIADEDLERSNEEKTSAVHFLRFEFSKSMIEDFKQKKIFYAGIDHPKYNFRAKEILKETAESLSKDFN
ncbi:MAG TPA: DUF3501 family protein [SAR86 cluster bacterium]|jgi:hypothetical protein|nr:DUF3501 family protein [SAR86 cluster bacterium]HJM15567.1 DUF3501 family protein [SAR86 cluster bacterium]|tara:strand:+ start:2717 stop:3301 length:585 start_codon:yes stop_codon:yes gene_type:complete